MTRVFVDFDGTITLRDVGDAMFEHFAGDRAGEIVRTYHEGRISAVECFRRECAASGEPEKSEVDAWIDRQEIDPAFIQFAEFCRSRSLDCTIVSDGMDYYIRRILNRHGLEGVAFHANRLDLVPVDGSSRVRFRPSFPWTDEVCDRCACCKRNHMLSSSGERDVIVYIGEGYSDRCPVRYADVVFAKDHLRKYCEEKGIASYPYATFADVLGRFSAMLDTNGIRKRRRAELARSEAFIGE